MVTKILNVIATYVRRIIEKCLSEAMFKCHAAS